MIQPGGNDCTLTLGRPPVAICMMHTSLIGPRRFRFFIAMLGIFGRGTK